MLFIPLFVSISLGALQVHAPNSYVLQHKSPSQIDALKEALLSGNWEKVKKIGQQGLNDKSLTLAEIESLARTVASQDLLTIVHSTANLKGLHDSIHFDVSDAFALSTFIETILKGKKGSFFSASRFNLPKDVERDPETGFVFILFNKKGSDFLGEGVFKVVTKSILYDSAAPQVIALAISKRPINHEIEAMRALRGLEGVLSAISFLYGDNRYGIVSPLYSPGGLKELIASGFSLSFKEKVGIARDILTGVANIHEMGYVHRDLNSRNFLVRIVSKGNSRVVSAVVSDLGTARLYKDLSNMRAQGNYIYVAPEGFFQSKMHGYDYVRTDMYAMGCVLWKLYFDETNPWGAKGYFKSTHGSLKSRRDAQVKLQEKYTRPVRNECKSIATTSKGQFLSIMLKLLELDPKKRGTAREAATSMNELYYQL